MAIMWDIARYTIAGVITAGLAFFMYVLILVACNMPAPTETFFKNKEINDGNQLDN